MGRWPAALVVATVASGASEASAQETTGASRWEITGSPGAPAFFGRDNRYGHRVYGGLLFGFGQ
jgi:hypothetical protein